MQITKRYFVDKDGIPTTRLQNRPGMSHFEIAQAVEQLVPGTDIYNQMFKLKYIRVGEDFGNDILYIDAPVNSLSRLTNGQRRWIASKEDEGWKVELNNRTFEDMRAPKAAQITDALIGEKS